MNLVHNELRKLPESIGTHTSLKKLYLTGNPLKALPESIGNLTSLEEILLDWEKITHFPKSITILESQKNYIYLRGFELTFFCGYQYNRAKRVLRNLDFLKNIKEYAFFRSDWQKPGALIWKRNGSYVE